MSSRLRIGLLGSKGKMGAEVLKCAVKAPFLDEIEITARPKRMGELEEGNLSSQADLWIDFSSPRGTLELLERLAPLSRKLPLVTGTTGWSEEELQRLETYATRTPVLKASNFSLGIAIGEATLGLWNSFPELSRWEVSIRESHHKEKKDSPSGTALTLREALDREVSIESIREGKTIGIHEVRFESKNESLTLVHEAKTRSVFAEGALTAAIRLASLTSRPARLLKLRDLYLRGEA